MPLLLHTAFHSFNMKLQWRCWDSNPDSADLESCCSPTHPHAKSSALEEIPPLKLAGRREALLLFHDTDKLRYLKSQCPPLRSWRALCGYFLHGSCSSLDLTDCPFASFHLSDTPSLLFIQTVLHFSPHVETISQIGSGLKSSLCLWRLRFQEKFITRAGVALTRRRLCLNMS